MKTANLLVGSAVSYRELQDDAFTALLAEQANIVVPENEMKWAVIHPEPDRFDFARGEALVSFGKEHGQKVRGHNLCWHEQLPKWFAGYALPQNAADLLRQHIAVVAGHYRGQIHSWDVVNEAINVADGRPDGFRSSPWLKLLGQDYIGIAFRAARRADPNAILTYNDYDVEQDGPKFDAKRKAVRMGQSDDAYVQILSGLSRGESVITGPSKVLRYLSDGERIAVGHSGNIL